MRDRGVIMDTSDSLPFRKWLRFAYALLWFVTSAASAKLVYWLYVDPAYGMNWSSYFGALLFALLSVYSAGASIISLVFAAAGWRGPDIRRGIGKSGRRRRSAHSAAPSESTLDFFQTAPS